MVTVTTDKIESILSNSHLLIFKTIGYGLEGTLLVIFEKDGHKGVYIMGYTELGNWVYLFAWKEFKYFSEYHIKKFKKIFDDYNLNEFKHIWKES